MNKIIPNSWNSNKQSDKTFNALKKSIQESGQVKNIRVAKVFRLDNGVKKWLNKGKLTILGGYHTWKAMKELGKEKILVKNEGEMSKIEAIRKSYQDNLRGEEDFELRGKNFQIMIAAGIDAVELAEITGVEISEIEKLSEIESKDKIKLSDVEIQGNKDYERQPITFWTENKEDFNLLQNVYGTRKSIEFDTKKLIEFTKKCIKLSDSTEAQESPESS